MSPVDPEGGSGALVGGVVVLDVANVMGSRPDGWWRDRAGAAERVLAGAVAVLAVGAAARVVAVLEGRARSASVPAAAGLRVVLAPGEGDDEVVAQATRVVAAGGAPWVVTADRGLRGRLPPGSVAAGPRWWLDLVGSAAPPAP